MRITTTVYNGNSKNIIVIVFPDGQQPGGKPGKIDTETRGAGFFTTVQRTENVIQSRVDG